ncbi:MAG: hypothetical protein Q9209_005657 [Squamulea sp. 1 TL-2023]
MSADVVIYGGGPVGLLTAYCLAQYGISTYVAEQNDKLKQTIYGRAAMIAPRSLEMLDQLDLANELGQIGFVIRGQKNYRDGRMVDSLSGPASSILDTFFDYCLLCRQRYTEEVMTKAYTKVNPRGVWYGHRLVNITISEKTFKPYRVTARFSLSNGKEKSVRCTYLISADGGSSTVRSLAGIPLPGNRNERYWVRVDGRVRTDMPDARSGLCNLDSPTHGSVLWACLDHGSTRVGFALPPAVWAQHGRNITQDVIIAQAKQALHPFSLEFDKVEWWTVYSIGQRLADAYGGKEWIILVGDAAHMHSSAAAQGMNTGLHDAVNLSWKLAGHIQNHFQPSVLESYETERRPVAQKIIDQDSRLSVLTGGEIPEELKHEGKDTATLIAEIYKSNMDLNTGLGIDYPINGTINVAPPPHVKVSVLPGTRAPDVMVQRPGPRTPVRLHSLLKNDAVRFSILVFCGDPTQTSNKIRKLRSYIDSRVQNPTTTDLEAWRRPNSNASFTQLYEPSLFRFLTIMQTANDNGAPDEKLGVPKFGTMVYDVDGSAHERYGIPIPEGAVVVLRPDGTVGTVVGLGDGESLGRYFRGILKYQRYDRKEDDYDETDEEEGGVEKNGVGSQTMGEVVVETEGEGGEGSNSTDLKCFECLQK